MEVKVACDTHSPRRKPLLVPGGGWTLPRGFKTSADSEDGRRQQMNGHRKSGDGGAVKENWPVRNHQAHLLAQRRVAHHPPRLPVTEDIRVALAAEEEAAAVADSDKHERKLSERGQCDGESESPTPEVPHPCRSGKEEKEAPPPPAETEAEVRRPLPDVDAFLHSATRDELRETLASLGGGESQNQTRDRAVVAVSYDDGRREAIRIA